ATVHALYEGKAAPLVEAAFPGTVSGGQVDRARLAAIVMDDPAALSRLDAIVHPLVRSEEREFVERHRRMGTGLVVLDIPLLFETGAERRVDRIVVVTASPEVQRARIMKREGMTEGKLCAILARQTPDSEKRKRADFLVDTDHGLEYARRQVGGIIAE